MRIMYNILNVYNCLYVLPSVNIPQSRPPNYFTSIFIYSKCYYTGAWTVKATMAVAFNVIVSFKINYFS